MQVALAVKHGMRICKKSTCRRPLALAVTQNTSAADSVASASHLLVSLYRAQEVMCADGSAEGTSCSTSLAAAKTSSLPTSQSLVYQVSRHSFSPL